MKLDFGQGSYITAGPGGGDLSGRVLQKDTIRSFQRCSVNERHWKDLPPKNVLTVLHCLLAWHGKKNKNKITIKLLNSFFMCSLFSVKNTTDLKLTTIGDFVVKVTHEGHSRPHVRVQPCVRSHLGPPVCKKTCHLQVQAQVHCHSTLVETWLKKLKTNGSELNCSNTAFWHFFFNAWDLIGFGNVEEQYSTFIFDWFIPSVYPVDSF